MKSSKTNLLHNLFRSELIGILLLFLLVTIGVTGYMILEQYSFNDALFMTIITMSTVGFQEVKPLSEAGQIFTSIFIVASFGLFAYVISNLTRYFVDGIFRNFFKDNKVKNKIAKLKDHVIVCGYGRNGKQAISELIDSGLEVVIIDEKENVIDTIRQEKNLLYVLGDASQDEILQDAGIERARALITTLPIDADNLFVVLSARVLNPDLTIISKASEDQSFIKLKRAGATNVIMSGKIGGQRMAKLVHQPDVVEFMEYIMLQRYQNVKLAEISCSRLSENFQKKSIRELDVRNNSGANILGLKNTDGTYIVNPGPEQILTKKHQLFVLGTDEQIRNMKKLLSHG